MMFECWYELSPIQRAVRGVLLACLASVSLVTAFDDNKFTFISFSVLFVLFYRDSILSGLVLRMSADLQKSDMTLQVYREKIRRITYGEDFDDTTEN